MCKENNTNKAKSILGLGVTDPGYNNYEAAKIAASNGNVGLVRAIMNHKYTDANKCKDVIINSAFRARQVNVLKHIAKY